MKENSISLSHDGLWNLPLMQPAHGRHIDSVNGKIENWNGISKWKNTAEHLQNKWPELLATVLLCWTMVL